jgi:hypothetical protein
MIKINITKESQALIEELVDKGWDFMLTYNQNQIGKRFPKGWEADFTRLLKKPNKDKLGCWDNHKPGYSKTNPNSAIQLAYFNIKSGKRL